MAYMPNGGTLTVEMSKLAGQAAARWYDPTSGKYLEVHGSPFANSGSRQFSPPGPNGAGDADWVLVLEVANLR